MNVTESRRSSGRLMPHVAPGDRNACKQTPDQVAGWPQRLKVRVWLRHARPLCAPHTGRTAQRCAASTSEPIPARDESKKTRMPTSPDSSAISIHSLQLRHRPPPEPGQKDQRRPAGPPPLARREERGRMSTRVSATWKKISSPPSSPPRSSCFPPENAAGSTGLLQNAVQRCVDIRPAQSERRQQPHP